MGFYSTFRSKITKNWHLPCSGTLFFVLVVFLTFLSTTALAEIEIIEHQRPRATLIETPQILVGSGHLVCRRGNRRRANMLPRVRMENGRIVNQRRARVQHRRASRRAGLRGQELRAEMRSILRPRQLLRVCRQLFNPAYHDSPIDPNSGRDKKNCLTADLNNDGVVDGADLLLLLQNWGPAFNLAAADINRDGVVDQHDLHMLFRLWGIVKSCTDPVSSIPDTGDNTDPGGDGGSGIDFDEFGIEPPYNPPMECGELAGSHIYYVSNSLGNDSWSGLLPEPNASFTDGPRKTLGAANNLIRNVATPGDCILLRRGDKWVQHDGGTAMPLGGVQGLEHAPIIIGAYGEDEEKPVLDVGGTGTIIGIHGAARYLVVRDLILTTTAPLGSRPKGIGIIQCVGDNRPEHIVLDSLEIRNLIYGATLQSNHITLKNSIISGNYKVYPEEQSTGHTQGVYAGRQCGGGSNIHLHNNIFESNGARQSWFDWNAYLSCTDCTFIGNHMSNPLLDWDPDGGDGSGAWVQAGSSGLKIRKPLNMIIRDNTITSINSVALSVGSDGGTFVGENVLIERNAISDTIDGITVRTQSSGTGPMRNLIIRNNLLFSNRPRSGANYNGYLHASTVNHYNTRIENNTFFDIKHKSAINVHTLGTDVIGSVYFAIRNNLIHMSDPEITALRIRGSILPVIVDGNLYDYSGQFLRRDNYDSEPRQYFDTLQDAQAAHPTLEPDGQEGTAGLRLENSIRGILPRLTSDSDAIASGACYNDMPEDFFRNQRPVSDCTLGAEEPQ